MAQDNSQQPVLFTRGAFVSAIRDLRLPVEVFVPGFDPIEIRFTSQIARRGRRALSHATAMGNGFTVKKAA